MSLSKKIDAEHELDPKHQTIPYVYFETRTLTAGLNERINFVIPAGYAFVYNHCRIRLSRAGGVSGELPSPEFKFSAGASSKERSNLHVPATLFTSEVWNGGGHNAAIGYQATSVLKFDVAYQARDTIIVEVNRLDTGSANVSMQMMLVGTFVPVDDMKAWGK